jgi:hypothetical protein
MKINFEDFICNKFNGLIYCTYDKWYHVYIYRITNFVIHVLAKLHMIGTNRRYISDKVDHNNS